MKRIKLTKRMQAIADLIETDSSVADIGTDHGYLSVYLAQNHKVTRIIASDISPASLKAAYRSAYEYDVTDSIEFIAAPGLAHITPGDVDTIIIAGMGGETILGILKDAPWTNSSKITIIIQPQSKIDLLCRFLYDSGYKINKTKTVVDKGKRYTIILTTGNVEEEK